MPTTRPRHTIAETDAVAHALQVARRRWPGEPATRLLTHLIETGASVVEHEDAIRRTAHEDAVAALTSLATLYPEGYLSDVPAGWGEQDE